MPRRTKILATLGPGSGNERTIRALIKAGVNVFRLNFSHGAPEDHCMRADEIRRAAADLGTSVGILSDLQGPKIRIGSFADNQTIILNDGETFTLDSSLDIGAGNKGAVHIAQALLDDIYNDDILLLDDGRITLKVTQKSPNAANCEVIQGGPLSSKKGVNKFGGGLSAPALTEKDKADIRTVARINSDYVAISFVQRSEDVEETRELLEAEGCTAHIVAKIERAEAITDEFLPGIIESANGIMVARGDLGVEIGDANLVAVQKQLIQAAIAADKVVITATQMMESMIHSPTPTRAEVFDVANAVLDGTDAVMLSAETAVGKYPVETVRAMARVIEGAERHPLAQQSKHRINERFERIDESIALASMYVANHLHGVSAVICLTESGYTPLLMSRINSSLPIFAMAHKLGTCERAALYKGVVPVNFDTSGIEPEKINQSAIDKLKAMKAIKDGDLVLMTKGDYLNVQGGTNTLKIVRIGDPLQ